MKTNLAILKPTLQEELTLFKAIARQITKHELDDEQARWFLAEERIQLRRLANLGVLAHQPAIMAVTKTTDIEKDILVRSILAQKVGHNIKVDKLYDEYEARDKTNNTSLDTKMKIRKAKISLIKPIKWKRRYAEGPRGEGQEQQDEGEEGTQGRSEYQSRKLQCTRCDAFQETRKIQLHTPQGYRDVHCKACGRHERCLKNKCQCGTVWHRCPLHRIDPPVHATRKGVKKEGKSTDKKDDKEGKKLSSWRKAPETRTKDINQRQTARRKMRKKVENEDDHNRNVKFVVSTAAPAEAILQRFRAKIKAGAAKEEQPQAAPLRQQVSREEGRAAKKDNEEDGQEHAEHLDHEGGDETRRKRKRIEDHCDDESRHTSWRGRTNSRALRTEDRKTLIENLKHEAAQQVQDKNSRIQGIVQEKGDEQSRGDKNDGTSSNRAPPRSNVCTYISRRRKDEAESITRLISHMRPP
jgi:hypothetical protein